MKERQYTLANTLKNIDKTCSDCSTVQSCNFGKNALTIIDNLPQNSDQDIIGKANAIEYVWFKKGNANFKCTKSEAIESEIVNLSHLLKN